MPISTFIKFDVIEIIQISGSGFNGSIGLAVYSDNELFSPKNASAEKLVSQSIKSVTTEHESHAINVNVSFGLTRNYNRR